MLKIGNEELVLNHRESKTAKAILAGDTNIDSDIEIGRGVMVAKQLSVVNERIPVWVINVKLHSVKLRKGTAVGDCVGMSMVQHLVYAIHHEPPKKVH